ncbi:hypothetical protein Leryth_025669 [Lithospermum erythrorhizon]|nr:hypothetical protein Leryth_025669 [Lithospermum erythrorhizon]
MRDAIRRERESEKETTPPCSYGKEIKDLFRGRGHSLGAWNYSLLRLSFLSGRGPFSLNHECLLWINSLISHNSSGHAFFLSLLSIFSYAMMEMECRDQQNSKTTEPTGFTSGETTSGAPT